MSTVHEDRIPKLAHVTSVQLLHDRVVRLAFDDGCEGVLDLAPRMHGPIFEKAASDLDYFRQVVVDNEAGTIVWPNGADLAPEVLHVEAATDCPDPWTRPIPRLALSLDREWKITAGIWAFGLLLLTVMLKVAVAVFTNEMKSPPRPHPAPPAGVA